MREASGRVHESDSDRLAAGVRLRELGTPPGTSYTPSMPTVSEYMSRDLLTVDETTPLVGAVREMHTRRVGAVLVLDGERLVGVFTERDVLRAVAEGLTADATVGDWMTRGPETIEPEQPGRARGSADDPRRLSPSARRRRRARSSGSSRSAT